MGRKERDSACVFLLQSMVAPVFLIEQDDCVTVVNLHTEAMAPVPPGVSSRVLKLSPRILG